MAEFTRARNTEQKLLRMNEIMGITEKLFKEQSYHEITLTTIAEALGWSRSNLYKYVTTKEEIFLELYRQKQLKYFKEIKTELSDKADISDEEFADIWTSLLDNNHDFLSYSSLLTTIIETNVTVEKLAEFKKVVSSDFNDILIILENCRNISTEKATKLYVALLFHASSLNDSCHINPLIKDAMKIAGLPEINIDFAHDFKEFILVYLKGCK